ncbi:arginine-tRNA-protein transferase, partial [Ramicandelaber brevisporus]
RLDIRCEPASFSEAKYRIYSRYQQAVHGDSAERACRSSFFHFLVESPLLPFAESDAAFGRRPRGVDVMGVTRYGLFHMNYYLDGELVAVGVVDVLPRCVSAVYFMYDPAFSAFGLGKLSALMEVYLTRLLCAEAALPDLAFYYMGYYIHAQPKMRYKAGYGPAALLEPFQQTWVPLDRCAPYLD